MRAAVGLLWRSRLRASLRRILFLGLITALGGGICLAVAAGAARTAGAYDEVLTLTNAGELGSSYISADPNDLAAAEELLRSIPAIESFSQIVGYQVLLPETSIPYVVSYALYSAPDVGQPLPLAGRLPVAANEVFINETVANAAGISIGDELAAVVANFDFTEFVPETLVVVGVGLFYDEVYEDETGYKAALVYSKAFIDDHPGLAAWSAASFTLSPGASRDDAVAQLAAKGAAIDDNRNVDRRRADDSIRPLVITLWALALLASIATIILVGQGIYRVLRRSSVEGRGLLAIGWTRSSLLAADIAVAATVAVAGAVGAVGVAIALSPLFPQGQARRIEELRGYDIDASTLGVGAVVLTVALCATVSLFAMRSTKSGDARPGRAPGILGSSPAVATGVRFATGRRGLTGTVATAVLGLSTIVAGVVFIGSLNNLVDRPDLAGFNWKLMGRDSYSLIDTAAVAGQLAVQLPDAADVERITGLTFVDASVNNTPVPGSVWEPLRGSPWPPILDGRAPAAENEMLAGPTTLGVLNAKIGDTVTVVFGDAQNDVGTPIEMTIVGTALSPPVGVPGTDTPRLGEGLLFRSEDIVGHVHYYGSAMLFDLNDQTSAASIIAMFPDGLPDQFGVPTEWFTSAEPSEVTQADSASNVLVLAMIALAISVLAAIGNNLIAFVRERRDAFAVLKAVGFTPRQIRTTVLWQSGSVIAVSLVVSVPLGLIFGRWLYQRFADSIGVIATPVLAVTTLLAVLLGTVLVMQVIALLPAFQARRAAAATALRTE
ncbi:hypothetical protein BH10ACT2_BH10ACT2_28180 [soil metagenome]